MLKRILKKYYGIDAKESVPIRNYQSCKKDDKKFFLVPLSNPDEEELSEREKIAEHLLLTGDHFISTFLRTQQNALTVEWDSKTYCVLKCQQSPAQNTINIGSQLAAFHYRGRTLNFQVNKLNRIGQWKTLWEKRIDQMEKVWKGMLYQEPENEFDRLFLESFPYYMAIGENAIQYLVDTELDDEPKGVDHGTVCCHRFTNYTWEYGQIMKNPFDWVFDHFSRDIAEWTRDRYLHNKRTYRPEVKQFFSQYQSVVKLSSFSWRLSFARIMFPLHYIECIEEYYSTGSEHRHRLLTERLEKYLYDSSEYEKFLRYFYQSLEVPVQSLRIPIVHWL